MQTKNHKTFLPASLILLGIILFGLLCRYVSFEVPFFCHHEDDWSVFGLQANDMFTGVRFRPFMYRQYYMGIVPLFMDVISFAVFGVSRASMFLRGIYIFTLYSTALYLLTRKIFSSTTAGLLSALCAAVMPYIAYNICPQPALGYLDNMTIGLFVFLITIKIINTDSERFYLWPLLGLLGGIGVWISFFAGYFLLPAFCLLVVAKPKSFLSIRPYTALLGFILGSLPFWLFNFLPYRKMSSMGVFGSGVGHKSMQEKIVFFFDKLQTVMGFSVDSVFTGIVHTLAGIVALAAFVYFITAFKKQKFTQFFKNTQNAGILLLCGYLALIFYGNLSSSKYAGTSIRYIYPVYPFVQIMLGAFLARLATTKRNWFYLTLGIWLLSQGLNLTIQNPRLTHRTMFKQAYAGYQSVVNQITALAKQNGAGLVATSNKWDAMLFEFDSIGSGVHYVEPLSPLSPQKAVGLLTQPKQFRLAHLYHINRLKLWFAQNGFTFTEKFFTYGDFHDLPSEGYRYDYSFFYNIKRTFDGTKPVAETDFELTSDQDTTNTDKATDGNINTHWQSQPQTPAQLTIKLKHAQTINEVILFNQTSARNTPSLLVTQTSNDGVNWENTQQHIVLSNFYPVFNRMVERLWSGIITLEIKSKQPQRYIRISCKGNTTQNGWSVNELAVFERTKRLPAHPPEKLIELLAQHNVQTVYADEVAAAWVIEKTNLRCFNEYTWDVWSKRAFADRSINLEQTTALVCPTKFAPFTKRNLNAKALTYKVVDHGNRTVFILKPQAKTSGLYWLSLGAGTCIKAKESYALANATTTMNKPQKIKTLKQALNLDPYNVFAAKTLLKLDPDANIAIDVEKYEPEHNTDIVFKDLMTISGYTNKNGTLSVFADYKKEYSSNHGRLLLFGLSPDGAVRYSKEIQSFAGKTEPFLTNGKNIIFKNQKMVYRFEVKDLKADTAYWVCFVNADNSRCPIESVNGKAYDKNRAKLL